MVTPPRRIMPKRVPVHRLSLDSSLTTQMMGIPSARCRHGVEVDAEVEDRGAEDGEEAVEEAQGVQEVEEAWHQVAGYQHA